MTVPNVPSYITISDYFAKMKALKYVPTAAIQNNAQLLLIKVNKFINNLYIKQLLPLKYEISINSGWRSAEWNQQLKQQGLAQCAQHSKHCTGQAVDIHGDDIIKLCEADPSLLELLDLYAESSKNTPTWTHLSSVPPKSKKRIFLA